jgi:hypothetical protein
LVDGGGAEERACFGGDKLSGNDVGVVFQHGKDDFIARGKELFDVGVRRQVDGLGGSPHEYDVVRGGRADEAGNIEADFLVGGGGAVGKFVNATVNVGVFALAEVREAVDCGAGLFGGGGVAEPDEGTTV